MTTWRQQWRPIICRVLAQFTPGARMRDKRRALRQAYPLAIGKPSWPYRVWCDEVRVQLGLKLPRRRWNEPPRIESLPGQRLFEEIEREGGNHGDKTKAESGERRAARKTRTARAG